MRKTAVQLATGRVTLPTHEPHEPCHHTSTRFQREEASGRHQAQQQGLNVVSDNARTDLVVRSEGTAEGAKAAAEPTSARTAVLRIILRRVRR